MASAATLKQNLDTLLEGQEICLIDYGSTDGLSHWVWSNFTKDIQDHRLRSFEVTNPVRWNVSRAKNLAHRIAQGKCWFSLDADNYITHNDIIQIQQAALADLIIHQFSGNWPDGSCGRVGIPKTLFNELGGYDEGMLPMGGRISICWGG